jgi:hypothetical protein
MVHQELVRAFEFARFCQNKEEAMGIVRNICTDFGFDMEDIEHEVLTMEIRIE